MKEENITTFTNLIIRYILTNLFIIFPFFINAQNNNNSFAKGTIIDTVLCTGNSSESYSLFLPDNYEDKKEWPVILIFDPAARGRTALEKFVAAGRKFGFILACSNNVKNGNFPRELTEAKIMYDDILKRFNIDDRRIFTAGFSGGSRLATAFSMNNKTIAGVIGCGAGMPGNIYYRPALMSHLIYFGLVGNKDMNLQEMNDLSLLFDNTGILSYFMIFSGEHDWPSSEHLEYAVGWIELQMMNKGVIEKRTDFLNDFLMKMTACAKESEAIPDLLAARKYYTYILRDFPGSPISNDISATLEKIEQSDSYKKESRIWRKNYDEEISQRQKYWKALDKIAQNNELPDSIANWWKSNINSLNTKTRKNGNIDSLMAHRLLSMITISSVEYGSYQIAAGNYKAASGYFRVWTICEPDKKNSWYNLARAYAMDRKKEKAIYALEKSVSNGYDNKISIASDTALVNLHNEKRYIKLIESMK